MLQTWTCLNCGNLLKVGEGTGCGEDDPIPWDFYAETCWLCRPNVHRRHLTPGQKAAVAVEAEGLYKEAAQRRMHLGRPKAGQEPRASAPEVPEGRALEHAAKAVGASRKSAQDAKSVKAVSPEVFEDLKNGTTSIRQALKATGRAGGGNRNNKPKKTGTRTA